MKSSIVSLTDAWVRTTLGLGLGLGGCIAIVAVLALLGAAAGLSFPKYEASALLDTPGASIAELKRVVPGYASEFALGRYLEATGRAGSPASDRLLAMAESRDFWDKVATQIVPLSRKDTKEIGDLKDGLTSSLIGLELRTHARDPETAEAMVHIMSGFLTNALLRERIRFWIVSGLGVTRTRQNVLRADITATQLNIDSVQRRIADLKAIGARYPDASRADGRQVISVAEGGDRFLPLPAQLVAAESNVLQLRESILRNERSVRLFDLLAGYYLMAEVAFKEQLLSSALITELIKVSDTVFSRNDPDAEWSRESRLRTQAAIMEFAVVQDSFGIRNGARASAMASRSPGRLGLLGVALGVALLGALAFLRATLRPQSLQESGPAQAEPTRAPVSSVKQAA